MPEHILTIESLDDSESYEVTFDFTVSYTPANFNGHPDNWYPEESDSDFSIKRVVLLDGVNKIEKEFNGLPKDIKLMIIDDVNDWISDNGLKECDDTEFDYDDYDDYDYPDNYVPDNYDFYGGP